MSKVSFLTSLIKWQSEASLRTKNFMSLLATFLFFWIVFFIVFLVLLSPRHGLFNYTALEFSSVLRATNALPSNNVVHYYTPSGRMASVSIADAKQNTDLKKNAEAIEKIAVMSLAIGLVCAAGMVFLFAALLSRKNRDRRKKEFIRGGELVEDSALAQHIDKQSAGSEIMLGRVPYIASLLNRHLGVIGDTGVGKSQLLFSVIGVLKRQKKKMLIVDKSGEFVQHFFDPKTDILLGPFDERTYAWTPYMEGKELFDCERLAKSFIPSAQGFSGKDDHWPEASVTVLSWILYRLGQQNSVSIDDLIAQLVMAENQVITDELGQDRIVKIRGINKLLKGTLAELVVDPDSPEHAASVIASIVPKIRALWYLRGLENRPAFSFREWTQDEHAGNVFIRVTEDQLDSAGPVISAWIDTVIKTCLSLDKSDTRELWAIIDELQSFDKINTLRKGCYEGRKYGLRMVLGFTSILELFSIYGQDSGKAFMSMLGTKAVFRSSEPDSAEWNARLLGDEEVFVERQSTNMGEHSSNVSVGEDRQRHLLVSGTEIQHLKDLNFYLRFAGDWPITKTELTYKQWPNVAPHFVPRRIPDTKENEASITEDDGLTGLLSKDKKEPLM